LSTGEREELYIATSQLTRLRGISLLLGDVVGGDDHGDVWGITSNDKLVVSTIIYEATRRLEKRVIQE
jgi:hypothetical protein